MSPSIPEPIAIVGSSCRFPGSSSSPSKLWDLLREPRDVRRNLSQNLNLQRFYHPSGENHGSTDVKGLGYLLAEDSRLFDPAVFGISPYEAETIDPQQRILLEVVYESMENAGYTLAQMRGSQTSVHVGVMTDDYHDIQLRDLESLPQYTSTGTARSIMANRISYVFDLHGPSVTIDTACSSSLVALHQAVQSLQLGEATCAVVGGVNLIFDPAMYIAESNLHMLSPDSQSRMWDKAANGYARGEGAAAVLLKPLSQALRDNDHIEGLIRGSGVNSDGQSPGITMPTATAQAALIRATYKRAGLDPIKDRCQYFECHGTGTAAGDPVEAQAISEALFEEATFTNETTDTPPLYVGSIKTVTGHLEGCAGLAGLLKALVSIKNRIIPPNMLFNELNPKIEPYYGRMQITTVPIPWPNVGPGAPLRVSINSFGFGGTNSHVILESYESSGQRNLELASKKNALLGPIVLSAHSGASLLGNAKNMLQYLKDNPSVNLSDFSYVLQTRRTSHRARAFFSSSSHQGLINKLQDFVGDNEKISKKSTIGIRHQPVNSSETPGILGVFTGQGAQWPRMGRMLLDQCPLFRDVLERCDATLQALPDRPEWLLVDELCKHAEVSRVGEAAISQPLCTAIQLGLLEVLFSSGIHFDAVVGHSSGEIAAVYACGIISLSAAMQIAFYRGRYASLAEGANGEAGAMMAVGISHREAQKFCQKSEYQGHISVAASNGVQSVTLSGDSEFIQRAKEHFESENVFARLLKVDTAYHSQHMKRCAGPYLQSLEACNIQVRQPREGCFWNSSVRGDTELLRGDLRSLKGPYWVQNMVQTVLFSQAVRSSIWHGGPYDVVIEVGPHPALKGPTEQTLQSAFGATPTYTGVLKRDSNDVEALFDAIGVVWAHLGPQFVNFEGLWRTLVPDSTQLSPRLLKDLPNYSWDHERVYWRESRISAKFRRGNDLFHELLGRRTHDDTDRELRWRNILKLSELPWVQGHTIMDEALLPGASYVAIAFQAGHVIAAGRRVQLMEVQDVEIRRPIVVPDSREGQDTIFTVHLLDARDPNMIEGHFSYCYCSDTSTGAMVRTCEGRLIIHLGETTGDELPPYTPPPPNLLSVDTNEGYEVLAQAGLLYSGIFRRLQDVERRLDFAEAKAQWATEELRGEYVVHPALLDVSFQSIFHARADPSTGKLPVSVLPVHIKRVAVNPKATLGAQTGTIRTMTQSFVTARDGLSLSGDIHVFDAMTGEAALQVEALSVKPMAPPTAEQDTRLFFDTVFMADPSLNLLEPQRNPVDDTRDMALVSDIDRVVLYYVQRVLEQIDPDEVAGFSWYFKRMLDAYEYWVELVRAGRHPVAPSSWLADEFEVIDEIYTRWPGQIELEIARAIGENIVDVMHGKMQMLEVLMENDRLGRMYYEGCGFTIVNSGLRNVMEQISNKYPQAKYLEIGAGTGSASHAILSSIGTTFDNYTYTDISTGFFENAAKRFAQFSHKMVFKTLDVEKDVVAQGYDMHSYDVVVASNVLHATGNLQLTLENARSLLKPGGFLLLIEITGIEIMRVGYIMGGLPGWWLGAKEGRRFHPGLTTEDWDRTLQDTGYSGVDLAFHDLPDSDRHCMSLLVSQAVDETVLQLREPLGYIEDVPKTDNLLLIGGRTLPISKLTSTVQRLAGSSWRSRVVVAHDIEAVDFSLLSSSVDVVCLQELDAPLFSNPITPKRLEALQAIILHSRNVLWVTKGRRAENPYQNMFLGMARAIWKEMAHVTIQSLDVETITNPNNVARTILETFLRMKILSGVDNQSTLLWTREQELIIEDGETLIARLRPNQELNDRYNARYRTVTKSVNGSHAAIHLIQQGDKMAFTETDDHHPADTIEHVTIETSFSLTVPGNSSQGSTYLVVGREIEVGTPLLAVSHIDASMVRVPQTDTMPIDEVSCNELFLERFLNNIFSDTLLNRIAARGSVTLYQPRNGLAAVIAATAEDRGIEVFFVCSTSGDVVVPENWIRMHPHSSPRIIQSLLPRNDSIFVNCSGSSNYLTSAIHSVLPSHLPVLELESWVFQTGLSVLRDCGSLAAGYDSLLSRLPRLNAALPLSGDLPLFNMDQIAGAKASLQEITHITSWEKAKDSLTLVVQPPDPTTMFDARKTYLMVGMAGGLGLSICEWMLRHGAKQMVITSRNPEIHSQWLADARHKGAIVHVKSMDVNDRASVDTTVRWIQDTLPPIAGVCNAAMVLTDRMFANMDADAINQTLNPKVNGSKYLDEVFANTPLDFFILLSSCGAIMGSKGQSNYHAANMYMSALATQRRERGFAASIIHIGFVTDVGYTTRNKGTLKDVWAQFEFRFLSEMDVHHAFAEAIVSGRPNSHRSCEVGVGINPLTEPFTADRKPAWATDPRFSHYLPSTNLQNEVVARSRQEDLKERLMDVSTEDEAVKITQKAFSSKLETMMQLPVGSVSVQVSLIELGIDSLVAVDIRNWFLRELGADIPVLKILGGDSVAHICTNAAKQLLAQKGGQEASEQEEVEPESTTLHVSQGSLHTPSEGLECTETSSVGGTENTPLTFTSSSPSVTDTVEKRDKGDSSVEEGPNAQIDPDDRDYSPDIIETERLSSGQSRIYILSRFLNNPTDYNLVFQFEIDGRLDMELLRDAFTVTTQHHESLRTCYFVRQEDNQPMQGVLASPVVRFQHVPDATADQIAAEVALGKSRIWDLERGDTMAMTVFSLSPKSHTMVFSYHHIIMDSTGWRVFFQDLALAYHMEPLQHASKTYVEYTRKQIAQQQTGHFQSQLQYWKQEYSSVPPVLPLLPMSRVKTRPNAQSSGITYSRLEIGYEVAQAMKASCQKLRITAFHFHLAVFQVMLSQLAGVDDICIGVADANRLDGEFAETVGFFMNMLPVRFHVSPNAKFSQIAQGTARKVLGAVQNSAVPFDMILDDLHVARSSSHTPLFQAAINYQLRVAKKLPFAGSSLTLLDAQDAKNPYDLSLGIIEYHSEGFILDMSCQESLYDAAATRTILDTYVQILEGVVSNTYMTVAKIPIHAPIAVIDAVRLGQGPQVDFSWPATLSQQFQAIHETNCENLAICDGDQSLTYDQLTDRVNSIASALRTVGHTTSLRVAVLCRPSVDFTASMLAILHIGALYIPLDISLPPARHAAIIDSARPSVVICHDATIELASQLGAGSEGNRMPIISVDDVEAAKERVPCNARPEAPAVLLYTSGSVGKPKGVVLTQANFVNHIALKIHELNLRPGCEKVLQQSSLGFDMSIIQTFCALCTGGILSIVPYESRRDALHITQLMSKHRITITIATPSEYLTWLHYGWDSLVQCVDWRWACMGGEVVQPPLMREFHRLGLANLSCLNCYGPTEITAAATFHRISLKEDVFKLESTVGKAIPNYTLRIVDFSGRTQPVGFRGEICIGGAGLALGYWESPEETARAFFIDGSSTRWYRTGDQGQLTADGSLVFLGRLEGSTQVKVRGLRIELEEVEKALLEVGASLFSTVVVTVRDDALVAYATPLVNQRDDIEPAIITQLLAGLPLPQYMCPSQVIIDDDLPCNSNGKIDRNALATLPFSAPSQDLYNPQTAPKLSLRQSELRILWEKVLPPTSHPLMAESDFFLEGGNSLRLLKLQHVIKESMGTSITTRELYEASTLQKMTMLVDLQRDRQTVKSKLIDWEAETAIPESLITIAQDAIGAVERSPVDDDERIEVLMTGATGFLGGSILKELLQNVHIRQVHCVAILPDEQGHLPPDPKVVHYTGSLSSPTLGLSPSECLALQKSIDVVIHAGANGHCLNNYTSVREANVHSTQFLASLCVPHSIPLLYISSPRVPLLTGNTAPLPGPVPTQPPTTGVEGYTASKWASKQFLQRISNHASMRIEIHRPCVVIGDRAPASDALNAILRYSLKMKCLPKFSRVEGFFDFKKVEEVAQDLVSSTVALGLGRGQSQTGREAKVHFQHHSSGKKVAFAAMAKHMEEMYGEKFSEMEILDWLERALKEGMDPLISSYLESLVENGDTLQFPYLGEVHSS
ncbi:Hybrid PKS-NRPS synthetase lepA [Penicillium oxalicum]|uniref:Hybrid PKS-NRPS synthetase lepA n=1 Tax=Penicillium oxalicum TaxID=69781 RepID=UPI0020B8CD71|nr:Hybrid PKS-NRPS synthetase lepA [Penicillium oxalicum]KAI2791888.1 Hybrid PKS-NRPS synthetase lepA [Penicillium oxalicum]